MSEWKSTDFDVARLHDMVLESTEFDWSTGRLELRILGHRTRLLRIVLHGCFSLELTRTHPWGRSESILTCEVRPDGDGARIFMEIQSGDTLSAVGAEVSFLIPVEC